MVLKPSRAYWFLRAENTSSKTGETGKGPVCGSLRGRLPAPGAAGAAGCPEASLPRLRLPLGLETQQRCGWRAGRGPHAAGCRLTSPCSLRPSLPAAHPAQAQGRPTAAVSPLCAQSLPAVGSPQHSPRPAIPLTSAASAVTPPNVSAVHLNGEAGAGPAGGRSAPSPTSAGGRPDERRSERVSGPPWAARARLVVPLGYQTPISFCKLRLTCGHRARDTEGGQASKAVALRWPRVRGGLTRAQLVFSHMRKSAPSRCFVPPVAKLL